jgi:hypothetical protein
MSGLNFEYDEISENFVLYFDVIEESIDVNSFAESIVAASDFIKSVNYIANPGWDADLEIYKAEFGSIKAFLRLIKKDTKNLIGAPIALIVFPFILNILSNWASSDAINIVVNDDSYIVVRGSERIVLPKLAAETAKKIEGKPKSQGIGKKTDRKSRKKSSSAVF